MSKVEVSYNYGNIERTLARLQENPDADVIYVGDDGESFAISVDAAESLIADTRSLLDTIYAKEGA